MANMHAGSISDDMSTATVVSTGDATGASTTWGKSAADPYVIYSIEDWETFVQEVAKDANLGSGKFYALANDLDFSNLPVSVPQFHMVGSFQGTFYGLGHSIKNIDWDNYTTPTTRNDYVYYNKTTSSYAAVTTSANYSNGGFGVFGRLNNAVVTDLLVENFSYKNVPQVASASTWNSSSIGGVVGVAYGTSFVLNCQTNGYISEKPSYTGDTWAWPAGVVGCSNGTMTIYRCSAEVEVQVAVASAHGASAGGIIGDVVSGTSCTVYDCAANLKVNATQGKYSHCGTCVAWSNGTIKIENFVGTMDYTDNSITPYSGQLGGSNVAATLRNIYVDGKEGATAGNAANLNLVPWTCSVSGMGTISNFNVVRVGDTYHAKHANAKYAVTANAIHATRAPLLAAAKNAVGTTPSGSIPMPATIWDKTKVDLATYTPANSPVRHFIKTAVKYFNHTTSGDSQYDYPTAGKTDAVEVQYGQNLYTPTNLDPKREFVGWTTDTGLTPDKVIMGDNVYTTVPAHLLGENNLYAVWKAKDVSLSIVPTGSSMTTNAETGAKEQVYNGSGITLSALLVVDGLNNPTCKYQWTKDREDITVGGTGDAYTVKNVVDSGVYNVRATYQSSTEPLYFGSIAMLDKDAVTVNIKPAPLFCTQVEFKKDTEEEPGEHAYSGAPYTSANPIALVYNKSDERVDGTAKWAFSTGFFNDPNVDPANIVKRGDKIYEKIEIRFEPDEKYGGNYGSGVRFTVEVEIEWLTFTFHIEEYDDKSLSFNLEYGNNYSFGLIADKFEELFKPYMGDSKLRGYSPAFVMNEGEEPVKINEYRALSFNGQTTAYAKVSTNRTLEVQFVYQTYTVKYNANNGSTGYYLEEKDVGHNMRLQSPVNPENGTKLFLGWYYTIVDPDTKKETEHQWDFTNDRVTRELVLTAKWLDANTLTGIKVTFTDDAEFNALEEVNPNHLIVTATFEGKDGDNTVTREAIVPYGGLNGYTITYRDPDDPYLHVHVATDDAGVVSKTDTITVSYTFRKGADVQTKSETVTLNVTPKMINTSELLRFFKPTSFIHDGASHNIKINTNVNSKFRQIKDDEIVYEYRRESGEKVESDQVIDIDVYRVRAVFKVSDDYEAPAITTTLSIISKPTTLTIDWGTTTFTYNGKVQLPTPTFTDPDGNEVEPSFHFEDLDGISLDDLSEEEAEAYKGDLKATDANKSGQFYTVILVFDDLGYTADTASKKIQFQILKAVVKKPTQTTPFEYRGEEYDLNNLDPDAYETYFDGFDPALMEAISGDVKAIDAGTYGVTIKLKNTSCSEWEGGGSGNIDFEWKINKAILRVSWEGSTELPYTGAVQVPKVNSLYTIYERDKSAVDLEGDLVLSGDINAHEAGEYRISVAFRSGLQWTKNYELNDTRNRAFSIIPDGVEIIYVKWEKNLVFDYNGAPQKPNYILTWGTADGLPLTEDEIRELGRLIQFNDEALKSKYAGSYTAEISLNAAGQTQYYLKGQLSCPYSIILNEAGEGADPGDGAEGPSGGNNPGGNTITGIPLWQLIVGGISALLFVFCSLKSYGEYGKAKAAKKETKQLASQSYYSFAPLGLLAMGAGVKFWGLEETPWTIIALTLLGLFLISAITLFIMTKKRKGAELALAREQARIAEEKELAKEEEQMRREEEQRLREEQMRAEMREEQARRDNEFKMMFAAMQQNYQQPQMQYGDMQNMIASTISALLPAMQQQMALPPAQDPNAYAAPQQGYGAPNYGAPNSEAEELRAMMAQQQAQMAQQQELINQLLQNQAAQQAAPVYEEEEIVDDISWLGENDELISLEESYGALSDEGKRAYYDIGSYIMSKPRTSQNDGRYAVLFKYRGRTLFKLAIKDGAPVLYYPAGNSRGEISILDASSLQVAKSMIDQSVALLDRELN